MKICNNNTNSYAENHLIKCFLGNNNSFKRLTTLITVFRKFTEANTVF